MLHNSLVVKVKVTKLRENMLSMGILFLGTKKVKSFVGLVMQQSTKHREDYIDTHNNIYQQEFILCCIKNSSYFREEFLSLKIGVDLV